MDGLAVSTQDGRQRDRPADTELSRVAVDETTVKINGEWSWLYATLDLETKVLLDGQLFKKHEIDPAAAFLHGVAEKHDCAGTVFLVDQFRYRTALTISVEWSSRLYRPKHIEKGLTPSQCESTEYNRGKGGGKYKEYELKQSISSIKSGLSELLETTP